MVNQTGTLMATLLLLMGGVFGVSDCAAQDAPNIDFAPGQAEVPPPPDDRSQRIDAADDLDSFGFSRDESKLSKENKKRLERYRQTQRRLGFERAGNGVDVEAGFEAASEH